jgi:hypothetical protein
VYAQYETNPPCFDEMSNRFVKKYFSLIGPCLSSSGHTIFFLKHPRGIKLNWTRDTTILHEIKKQISILNNLESWIMSTCMSSVSSTVYWERLLLCVGILMILQFESISREISKSRLHNMFNNTLLIYVDK